MSTSPSDELLSEVLSALKACAVSALNTGSDTTAERCAHAARDLAETYRCLVETRTPTAPVTGTEDGTWEQDEVMAAEVDEAVRLQAKAREIASRRDVRDRRRADGLAVTDTEDGRDA